MSQPEQPQTPPTQHLPAKLFEEMEWSKAMALSNLLPSQYRNHAPNLLFAVQYAEALGIPRINALTSIHVIEGKPSMSADLMAARVRAAGHKLRITATNQVAKATLIRCDDPDYPFEVEFTIEDAQRAGLIKPKGNWEKYPRAMLRARAITEVVRTGASDVMCGIVYAPEELGAIVNEDGSPVEPSHVLPGRQAAPQQHTVATVVVDATPDVPRLDADTMIAAVNDCDSIECWRELWRQAKGAPNFADVRDAFMRRGEELKNPKPKPEPEHIVDVEVVDEDAEYDRQMQEAESAAYEQGAA